MRQLLWKVLLRVGEGIVELILVRVIEDVESAAQKSVMMVVVGGMMEASGVLES